MCEVNPFAIKDTTRTNLNGVCRLDYQFLILMIILWLGRRMFLFLGNHIVQQKALSIIFATFPQYIKFVIIKYI